MIEGQHQLSHTCESNQGSNVEIAKEMVEAIQSLGGVPGVDVTLCSPSQIPKPSLNVKIEGVSLISNIEFNDGRLRFWKAYVIRPGTCIQLSKFGIRWWCRFQIS